MCRNVHYPATLLLKSRRILGAEGKKIFTIVTAAFRGKLSNQLIFLFEAVKDKSGEPAEQQ